MNERTNTRLPMPKAKRIQFNPENCTGCLSCELACSSEHFGVYSNKLSAIRMDIDFRQLKYDCNVCKQCPRAFCVEACPKDAIHFDDETGARYIDQEACIRCGKCIKACPFQKQTYAPIKKVSYDNMTYIVKCDLCHGREGGSACVEVCPRLALSIVG